MYTIATSASSATHGHPSVVALPSPASQARVAPSITGAFHVQISLLAGEGASCGSDGDCGTGLDCNPPIGSGSGSGDVCAKPQCSDGIDNNGDGKKDFPNDPGCENAADNTETTVCPGTSCPECSDGSDNDGDGKTDFPNDPSCSSAGGTSESCTTVDPIIAITGPATDSTLVGAADDFQGCNFGTGTADQIFSITLPALASLTVGVVPGSSFFGSISLLDSTCGGTALTCNDGFVIGFTQDNVPAGNYFLMFDGDSSTSSGPFTLNVQGEAFAGARCDSQLFTSGILTCGNGSVCGGPAGNKKCIAPQCSDGVDNNGDGKIDYPNDPGCTGPLDNSETTIACPGASCPVCSDTVDNDGDGKKDFPADFGCSAASGTSEVFCPADNDAATVIKKGTTTSTFVGAHNDLGLDCGTAIGHDRSFALQLPVPVTSLTIDTATSTAQETVLELWSAQCDGEVQCADGEFATSSLSVLQLAAGNYAVSAQAYNASNGQSFVLNTHGTVAAGTVCSGAAASALFTGTDPVLTCDTGLTCSTTTHKCE